MLLGAAMSDNLPELRDIHLPDGVSIFPPAYGWWVILGCIIAFFVLYKLAKDLYRRSKKRYALHQIQASAGKLPLQSAIVMSEILRRICVMKYAEAASLSGDAWLAFLQQHTSARLSDKAAQLLAYAPYMPQSKDTFSADDVQNLQQFCQSWIGENL